MAIVKSYATMLIAVSFAFVAGAAVAAEEGAITCQLDGPGAKGWVPPIVAVIVNDKGEVTVSDPIILHFHGVPVSGRIAVENARRITYAWTLEGARDNRRQFAPKMDYRLTVQKPSNDATMSITPRNYGNTMRGEGRCAPLKRK